LAKVLKRWHRKKMSGARREATEAQELIMRLDQLQDVRQLTSQEHLAHKEAKNKTW
jgi:hypothetical protein